ncbi:PAAR domain-containing protein [Massilia glaciei]|uniref:PAAR domain-containing protein n=1 Tax=Massilia glaciei TaxID=1524097 RepID=A0A2U2HF58_9BURK|nr:PAAR domain-containing protein [Massilia glaciei]PWF42679.1 PAAR domain-containing protein [Massilia glaciei]
MRGVIRLNDPTTHGGKVISAASNSTVMGRAVARVGDRCFCPQRGHEICVIAEGDPKVLIDGIPVAFEGHLTSCGAKLMSTVPDSTRG